jgi:hypothetical protein
MGSRADACFVGNADLGNLYRRSSNILISDATKLLLSIYCIVVLFPRTHEQVSRGIQDDVG